MSYEDMATTLDVSKGTVMSRLFHARRKMQTVLRDLLGDEVPPPEADVAAPHDDAPADETE